MSSAEVPGRAARHAGSRLGAARGTGTLKLLAGQFTSPISLLLIAAAVISIFLHDGTDAAIILTIVFASGLLGFWQERGAAGFAPLPPAYLGAMAAIVALYIACGEVVKRLF